MSLFLYRLGHAVGRHRLVVVATWVALLFVLLAGARVLGTHYDDTFSIPGTDSQRGQDVLAQRFPQASGATGQVVFTTDGGAITAAGPRDVVESVRADVARLPGVRSVSDPFASSTTGSVSSDGRAAVASVQFRAAHPSAATQERVQRVAADGATPAVEVVASSSGLGGSGAGERVTEGIGIAVAFLVMLLTFGSFLAAGMPLLSALAGVVATSAGIAVVSRVTEVSTTAPTLAEMLGLAVGIDYALFILFRHRAELAGGAAPREAMARALGTAGSSVVFAGLTVVIALLGLSVAGIPFLTVMGVAGAVGVAVAVLVALTLLPAVALLLGRLLVPRRRRGGPAGNPPPRPPERRHPVAARWVALVTRVPVVTVLVVLAALAVCALPATRLSLALPDNGSQPVGSPQRVAYDRVTEHFGPGFTAPLVVTADLLGTDDPSGAVDTLRKELGALDGVRTITTATPDAGGDTALVRIIPDGGQNAPGTAALVDRIRSETPRLERASGARDLLVTGTTASDIDVSARLANALLPFAIVVVGLSILLLMLVFRSLAIPVKATLGYLLSVGASLGAVVAVFQLGWAGDAITGGARPGPVLSFLPIIVMGVLFGLAMDYEMFLVSRMREHHAKHGDARTAVRVGFQQSSPVVTAAATIMLSVFVAFIPNGSPTIRPIAFGLAVGVVVDAFVVRMTLVPAVLALLGELAWKLPRWLDRALPHVDVEGAAIDRRVRADRTRRPGDLVVAAAATSLPGGAVLDVTVPDSGASAIPCPDVRDARAVAHVLAGRARPDGGLLVVDGALLPEEAGRVLGRVAFVDLAVPAGAGLAAGATVAERVALAARSLTRFGRRRRTVTAAYAVLRHAAALTHGRVATTALADRAAALDPAQRVLVDGAVAVALRLPAVVVAPPWVRAADDLPAIAAAAATIAQLGVPVVLPVAERDLPPGEVHGLRYAVPGPGARDALEAVGPAPSSPTVTVPVAATAPSGDAPASPGAEPARGADAPASPGAEPTRGADAPASPGLEPAPAPSVPSDEEPRP